MRIEYKVLDTLDPTFEQAFSEYKFDFYFILSKSYSIYYGNFYHSDRIKSGKAILYLGLIDNKLVAVSYVKRNCRRGGIAVYPEKYRRLGLARNLVKLSLKDFPRQYTIISMNNEHSHIMLSLMNKLGFKMATSEKEIRQIVNDEFALLSNFRFYKGNFVFDRESSRREEKREFLTLLHTF